MEEIRFLCTKKSAEVIVVDRKLILNKNDLVLPRIDPKSTPNLFLTSHARLPDEAGKFDAFLHVLTKSGLMEK